MNILLRDSTGSPCRAPLHVALCQSVFAHLGQALAHPRGTATFPGALGKGRTCHNPGDHRHCSVMGETIHILVALGLAWCPAEDKHQTRDEQQQPWALHSNPQSQALLKTLLSPKEFNTQILLSVSLSPWIPII